MDTNYKHYDAVMNNTRYRRGSDGVSIMGLRRIQNAIRIHNSDSEYRIEIHEIKGEYNGYGYPILDKTIRQEDVAAMTDNPKLVKYHEVIQALAAGKTAEDMIIDEFCKEFRATYPSAPDMVEWDIMEQYTRQGRRESKEMISRMYALVIAHIRHRYTDYEDYLHSGSNHAMAKAKCTTEAHKIASEWQREDE